MALPFWLSDAALLGAQAAAVALPAQRDLDWAGRLRGRAWASIPVVALVGTIVAVRATSGSATVLADVALVAVPILAAGALGWAMRGARAGAAPVAGVLFLVAALDRTGLLGDAARLALIVFSCVTLGVLLAGVAPPAWLKVGIVLMALADTALTVSDLLQAPNGTLNAAVPPGGLPSLQRAQFGSAVMGYGDLFVAAVLGAVIVREGRRSGPAALLVLAIASVFDLLFFAVDEVPATVPVAAATIALNLAGSPFRDLAGRGRSDAAAPGARPR
jgi:hypothetical protein